MSGPELRLPDQHHVYIGPGFWRRLWAIIVASVQHPTIETVIHQKGHSDERW